MNAREYRAEIQRKEVSLVLVREQGYVGKIVEVVSHTERNDWRVLSLVFDDGHTLRVSQANLQRLVDACGTETTAWVGRSVRLSVEQGPGPGWTTTQDVRRVDVVEEAGR